MFDLTDTTALVTGASGAIGGAIARTLAKAGARVALSGTREDALAALQAEIAGDSIIVPADLADINAVEALVPEVTARLGRLDILINNAGSTQDNLSMMMTDEEWRGVLAINLDASFRLTRAALRGMIRARFGRIIAISSIVGATGNAGQANYAASKGGLVAMAKAIAQEVAGRGVTVNCIAPGLIESAMTDRLTDAQRAAALAMIPVGRIGSGVDVAAAALFLASREAGYLTGQTIHVNGGMAMM